MCFRLLQSAWIVTACLYLSGCATLLYTRGTMVQMNGGGKPAISRLEEVVETDKAYVTATKVTEYRTYDGLLEPLLLELTPLGIMGPLVGYPQKSYEFTGALNVHTDPPEAASRVRDAMSFTIDGQSGSRKILLDFAKGVDDALRTTGRSIEYSPESIELTVTCAGVACRVTAQPDVISSDGLTVCASNHARF